MESRTSGFESGKRAVLPFGGSQNEFKNPKTVTNILVDSMVRNRMPVSIAESFRERLCRNSTRQGLSTLSLYITWIHYAIYCIVPPCMQNY